MTEFGLISSIKTQFASIPTNGIEGIGDDCAVLPTSGGESLLMTTDMLVEDVHFLREGISAYELGRKSLAVNLSDVAAMGGRPVASELSLALPKWATGEWIEEFMRGYHALSAQYSVPLIGGDTTSSKSGLVINVVAIGRAASSHIKRRSAAQVGDVVLLNGEVGASGAGLSDILSGRSDSHNAYLHRNPQPQVLQGEWLGSRAEVRAMMDVSDGVASDVRHIMEQSHVGVSLDLDSVPTQVDVKTAMCGGEDYVLLLTAEAESCEALMADYAATFGSELYPIGVVTSEARWLEWRQNGQRVELDWCGFRHY